jgi:hypothetical protein
LEHFVTLIDSLFLPQVLALHASMQRSCGRFTLWVLCVDDVAHQVLERLSLPDLRLLRLSSLETAGLLAVRAGRTRAEYCWTLTPFAPRFVFEAERSAARVTYLDADLWFLRSPEPLFREMEAAKRGVLITEHAYAPRYDQSVLSGRFCVQFVSFCRETPQPVREWWEARCMEWCFARFENGLFGDQKYLDDWPERFATSVHVLEDASLAAAPWNAERFDPREAVFFHFHSLRLLRGGMVMLAGGYELPRVAREHIYEPYIRALGEAVFRLRSVGWEAPAQDRRAPWVRALLNLSVALRQGWREPFAQAKVRRLPLPSKGR